jgi:hypothetical protein
LGRLFFGHFAASLTTLGGLNFRSIQKGMDFFGVERMPGQDSHHRIDQLLQGLSGDGLNVGSDRIRTEGPPDGCGFLAILSIFLFCPPFGSAISDLSAIESDKSHQRLTLKYDGVGVPKECQACHHPHEIDEDDGRKVDIALTLGGVGIELKEEVQEVELFEEVEELVKQSGLSKPIYLGDIFSLGEVLGNT